MYDLLIKSAQNNKTLNMIYMAKNGAISKRRVAILHVGKSTFKAYCYLRGTNRTFIIKNVLALVPVIRNEREVVSS